MCVCVWFGDCWGTRGALRQLSQLHSSTTICCFHAAKGSTQSNLQRGKFSLHQVWLSLDSAYLMLWHLVSAPHILNRGRRHKTLLSHNTVTIHWNCVRIVLRTNHHVILHKEFIRLKISLKSISNVLNVLLLWKQDIIIFLWHSKTEDMVTRLLRAETVCYTWNVQIW